LATGAIQALGGHTGTVLQAAFSPDGTLLATASNERTIRIWDMSTGKASVTLAELPDGGYVALSAAGYRLEGDLGNDLWWAIKLCRFEPGELDPYVPGLRRLSAKEPIPLLPGTRSGLQAGGDDGDRQVAGVGARRCGWRDGQGQLGGQDVGAEAVAGRGRGEGGRGGAKAGGGRGDRGAEGRVRQRLRAGRVQPSWSPGMVWAAAVPEPVKSDAWADTDQPG
jgi:hypothetical protein